MATIEEKNILINILSTIGASHSRLPRSNLCGFLSVKGRLYKGGLMVVGRAVNGWGSGISPVELINRTKVINYVTQVFESVTRNCPMSWVSAHQVSKDNPYNPRKSAFWRAIKAVVDELGIASVTLQDWPEHLVWSNLYKVSPHKGNPDRKLCHFQLSYCKELLRIELDTYMPARLLFLTGIDWARPFLGLLGTLGQTNTSLKYVHIFGQTILPGGSQCRFAVASHPQGKPRTPWVNEVLQVL